MDEPTEPHNTRTNFKGSSQHHDRPSSKIVWTKGVGCVGLAWANNEAVTVNLARSGRKKYLKNARTWATAPVSMTQNVLFKDAKTVESRDYKSVAAHPFSLDADTVVAVVALDFPKGCYNELRTNKDYQKAVNRYLRLYRDDVIKLSEFYL